jgi:hypothetical protein
MRCGHLGVSGIGSIRGPAPPGQPAGLSKPRPLAAASRRGDKGGARPATRVVRQAKRPCKDRKFPRLTRLESSVILLLTSATGHRYRANWNGPPHTLGGASSCRLKTRNSFARNAARSSCTRPRTRPAMPSVVLPTSPSAAGSAARSAARTPRRRRRAHSGRLGPPGAAEASEVGGAEPASRTRRFAQPAGRLPRCRSSPARAVQSIAGIATGSARASPSPSHHGRFEVSTLHGGKLARNCRPYGLRTTRGSRTTTIPRSLLLRIRRPKPWRNFSTASGSW